jgi:hypothetical protein
MRLMAARKGSRKPLKQARYKVRKGDKKGKKALPDIPHPSAADHGLPRAPDGARVVALPVDPYLIHVYWTLTPENIAAARLPLGNEYERTEAVLRFHANHLASDKSGDFHSFDVRVDLNAPNWYVHLRVPDKSYYADLGLRTEDGRFFWLARSNVVEMPRIGPIAREEARDMLVEGNYQHAGQFSIAQSQASLSAIASEGEPSFDLTGMTEKAFDSSVSSTAPRSRKSGT